jgi:ABC-type transporter Mla subunit MlaD
MADPPRYPDTDDDTGVGPDRESITGTPRWVKVFGIIAIVVVLLFVILMFAGGGTHGPGRHTLSGDLGGQAPPSSVTDHGVQQL